MSRPIFEIADELIRNVSEGEFGKAFQSVRFTDVDDPDETVPSSLVIVAKGEHAALLSRAYSDAMAVTVDLASRIENSQRIVASNLGDSSQISAERLGQGAAVLGDGEPRSAPDASCIENSQEGSEGSP